MNAFNHNFNKYEVDSALAGIIKAYVEILHGSVEEGKITQRQALTQAIVLGLVDLEPEEANELIGELKFVSEIKNM